VYSGTASRTNLRVGAEGTILEGSVVREGGLFFIPSPSDLSGNPGSFPLLPTFFFFFFFSLSLPFRAGADAATRVAEGLRLASPRSL